MTELFLELSRPVSDELTPEGLAGFSGLVVDGTCVGPAQCRHLQVPVIALTGGERDEPADWCGESDPMRVVDGGLDACARLRDASPELSWTPRLIAYRPEVRYQMSTSHGQAGFKFYAPDTAAIRGYRVSDGDLPLYASLQRARELGFGTLWLHAQHAAEQGRGLDLDLLERAKRVFHDGLWLSGGATGLRHLRNLTRAGGVPVLVVEPGLLAEADGQVMADALAPPPPPEAPIHFEPRRREDCGAG
ncbi:MAG: hypothetical protein U9Q81_12135 [Pseudomonadota bacterium]|nr:hypothetical protein [Pseudomonadota bacterium]